MHSAHLSTNGGGVGDVIGVYRTRREVVHAFQHEDGTIRIVGRPDVLSAEDFAARFEPATQDDLVQAMNGNADTPAESAAPARTPRYSKSRKGGQSAGSGPKAVPQEILDFAEQLWIKGEKAGAVAMAVSKKGWPAKTSTIYNWSSKHKWERGERPANGRPKGKHRPAENHPWKEQGRRAIEARKSATDPTRTVDRRCEECGQQTNQDPCGNCGEKWEH